MRADAGAGGCSDPAEASAAEARRREQKEQVAPTTKLGRTACTPSPPQQHLPRAQCLARPVHYTLTGHAETTRARKTTARHSEPPLVVDFVSITQGRSSSTHSGSGMTPSNESRSLLSRLSYPTRDRPWTVRARCPTHFTLRHVSTQPGSYTLCSLLSSPARVCCGRDSSDALRACDGVLPGA